MKEQPAGGSDDGAQLVAAGLREPVGGGMAADAFDADSGGSPDFERTLRASERRLAHVLDVMGEGLWDWDLVDGTVTHNRRWCEIVGVGDEFLQQSGDEFERLLHPGDRAAVMQCVTRCLRGGEPLRSEHRIVRPDGRVLWVSDRGAVVERDPSGRALRMVGSIADITARKVAELDLRIKDAAIVSSLNGIALADLEGRITYVNPAFCRLWGLDAAAAIGRLAIEFWSSREPPQAVIDTLSRHGRWAGELEGRRTDGTLFHAAVSASLVRGDDGQPLCLMGSFVDVTAQHRAQQALQGLNEALEQRIEQRTAELARAKAEAERANRAKSEFLSSMSHELRTPLNAVLGFAQLLQLDASLSPRSQDRVREILRGGRHLLELIDEVLDLARVESGRLRLAVEPVDVEPLLRESLDLLAPLAAARDVQLPPSGSASAPALVRADRTRVRQVLMNLLSNAIKYNRAGGRVAVAAGLVAGSRLRIEVSDTGTGIPPERIDELFQPFHRLAPDAAVEGTGMGLVITRGLVELMGGTLDVRSTVGEGTTFGVELPLA